MRLLKKERINLTIESSIDSLIIKGTIKPKTVTLPTGIKISLTNEENL